MADVTGPISTLPGTSHAVPDGMMCDDHARGCEGREYTCTCGYDDERDALIERLKEENADLRSELYRRGQEADDTWLTERERAW